MDDFYTEFLDEINYGINNPEIAEDFGTAGFRQNFTRVFLDELQGLGTSVWDHSQQLFFKDKQNEMDGFSLIQNEDICQFSIFLSIPKIEDGFQNLNITPSEISKALDRLEKTTSNILSNKIHLDESTPQYLAFNEILKAKGKINKINFYIFTGGKAEKIHKIPYRKLSLFDIEYDIRSELWTLDKLKEIKDSDYLSEDIEIDFENDYGGSIECINAISENDEITAFVTTIRGELLADLYHEYNDRLLQKNVRCFLKVNNKVNKKVRETIRENPTYFFPYNNGICITINEADISESKDKNISLIKTVKDLQIVNGGQTTVSLYHSKYKDKVDISKTSVMAKIALIKNPEKSSELVENIARYANAQSAVPADAFSSSKPFHIGLENLSRSTLAPAKGEGQKTTIWWYDRLKGSYGNAAVRENKTRAQRKVWDAKHPRDQLFKMVDLARYVLTFNDDTSAALVSQSAQKVFTYFTIKGPFKMTTDPTPQQFKIIIAKKILYDFTRKLYMKSEFYVNSSAAYVTIYSLSKLKQIVGNIDFIEIWNEQIVPQKYHDIIIDLCYAAKIHLIDEFEGDLFTEYAKKEECWKKFKKKDIKLQSDPSKLVNKNLVVQEKEEAKERKQLERQDKNTKSGKPKNHGKRYDDTEIAELLDTAKIHFKARNSTVIKVAGPIEKD